MLFLFDSSTIDALGTYFIRLEIHQPSQYSFRCAVKNFFVFRLLIHELNTCK